MFSSWKRSTIHVNKDNITSENEMKRLIRIGVDVKTACSYLDITSVYSFVEDVGMFELFESAIDEVKFPLESIDIFNHNNDKLQIIKEYVSSKYVSSIIKDKCMSSSKVMSFVSIFLPY